MARGECKIVPTALIPDISRVFQAWLISTQNQLPPFNAVIVGLLFEWLTLIEEAMSPRMWRNPSDAPPSLNIPHFRDVRDEVRMTAFLFSHFNPEAAERYLSALDPDAVRHDEMQSILKAPGLLPEPHLRRWRVLRSGRLSRRKTPTTCTGAETTGSGRSACMTVCCHRHHRVRALSSSSWSTHRPKVCA